VQKKGLKQPSTADVEKEKIERRRGKAFTKGISNFREGEKENPSGKLSGGAEFESEKMALKAEGLDLRRRRP